MSFITPPSRGHCPRETRHCKTTQSKTTQSKALQSATQFSVAPCRGPLAFGLLLFLMLWVSIAWMSPMNAAAQENGGGNDSKELDIVVQFDNQGSIIRNISFTEEISGLQALLMSDLDVVTVSTSFGPAVCSIEGVGCPADDCFCGGNFYWGYSYWDGDAWQSYPVGAGSSTISQTGAVEGWLWGQFGDVQTPYSVTQAAEQGLSWLLTQQISATGGFGGASGSVETLLAVGANNQHAETIRIAESSPSPSLESAIMANVAAFTRNIPGGAGKAAVAVAAGDSCLPVAAVTPSAHYSPTLGTYNVQNGANTWYILGSAAISETVPVTALTSLRDSQQADGGWEWAPTWGSDTNTTALSMQALIATGESVTSTAIISGVAYLKSTQQSDGGFPYALSEESQSDTNSTSYVVQALAAAQEDVLGAGWTISGTTPIDFMLSNQLADGSFEWQSGTGGDQIATRQAIPALLGRSFPVRVQVPEACPATYLPYVSKSGQ